MHARLCSQSELTIHSGRQLGGLPKNPGRHEHEACSPKLLHTLLGPHGEGSHGLPVGPKVDNKLVVVGIYQGIQGFLDNHHYKLTLDRLTKSERIAFIISNTTAHRNMIDNIALGIATTYSRAGVNTFIVTAGLVEETI